MTNKHRGSSSDGESGRTSMTESSSPPLQDPNPRGGDVEEEGKELWKAFSNNFHEVETVLNLNRTLIQQVNENHQSLIPANMTKNVALIQQINGNVEKVVSLYSDLSLNFSNIFHHRKD